MRLEEIIYIRVGVTRSGKIIPYTSSIESLEIILQHFRDRKFSANDYFDALAVFDYLTLRAMRRGDESRMFERFTSRIAAILSPSDLLEARISANIRSAFDMRDLARSLVAVEFTDF